jgi:cytochrome c oxidase subunit 3
VRTKSSNFIPESREPVRIPPLQVFTFLAIGGISSAFIFLLSSYLGTVLESGLSPFQLPAVFHANSVIILVSSYSMVQARQAFSRADWPAFRQGLGVTVLLGSAFTVFQIYGWTELLGQKISMVSNLGGAYLYVISGLHLLHLLVGLLVLAVEYMRTFPGNEPEFRWLIYETNPENRLRVRMSILYWHFVDGLWLLVYAFLLLVLYGLPAFALV